MNEYRPLNQRFRLAMPYHPDNNDWRTAAIAALVRAVRLVMSLVRARVS
jgi:hypothetical protein